MRMPGAKSSRPRTLSAAVRHSRKALCARLRLLAGAPDDHFVREFGPMVAQIEAGFRREELLLGTLGYERLREQREENAVVLRALHRVLPRVEAGDLALGRQVLAAMMEVLSLHRLSAGLALALAPDAPPLRVRGSAARATQHVGVRLRHPR